MSSLSNVLMWLLLALMMLMLIVPIYLTSVNIFNLIERKKFKENFHDILTFLLGTIFTIVLFWLLDFKDYTVQIRYSGIFDPTQHEPLYALSMPTVYTILTIGFISYVLIRIKKAELSPLLTVFSMAGITICITFCIVYIIHVTNNFNENWLYFYLPIFPANYILCAIRAEIEIIKLYKEKQIKEDKYENKFLDKCNNLLIKIDLEKWPFLAILFSVPLALCLIVILCLCGQRPDAVIKAFTSTSDWRLSQMYSPPPVYYDAHYLCTVSLRGHKNVVKPLRYGIRRNQKIVVNRQLCIANAFEQVIEEKTPRFHKFIRYIYDKYGYPISKHINTPLQADVTYILMKPLEYIFLIVLYLVDKKPENRIAKQYLPKDKSLENI